MDKRKVKRFIGKSVAVLAVAFAILSIVSKRKKRETVYDNEPEQKNPLEGKKVIFVEDENDKENADGIRGHLEAIGDCDHRPSFYERYIKRGIDIVLSFGGLVVLSPVFALTALAIKIEDPGPVFFTQKRVGQNKKYFKLHKFRSMKMCTPHDVPTHMLDNPDQYITKVGKFIRAHSLDELPQIWDIFVGNMSVIGPRPGLWNQDLLTAERDKYGANDVKPGLTGWAQINGRDELEIPDKAKLDGEYVRKLGPIMDAKVFLGSLHVFGKDDSVVEGGTGEISKVGRHYTDGKSDEELIGHFGFGEPVTVDTETKKKVLITGAGSYIGESFKKYAEEHYSALDIETLDMLDPDWKKKDFSKFDIVYHVAGLAHADVGSVDDDTKAKYYAINTDLAVEVCKKAKSEGVKEFVFISSMIVYGDSAPYGKDKIIDEHTVPKAANFYGDSKLQADVAVRSFADDSFKVLVIRPPMIYGKGSKGNYPTLAKLAKKLPVFPDVDNKRSMLHIDNLCEFLCQIMLVSDIKENATVFMPQNAEWTKTSDMVKRIADVSGKKIRTLKIFRPAVYIGSKVPGKIGGLVNKAFGNSCYEKKISEYCGINYRVVNLKNSIIRTENDESVFNDIQDVTFIVLTKNEEINLPDCLESIKGFAKRVVVIDSGSSDKTVEIARTYGADVYEHEFENYARQFNWGIDNTNITTKWTFRLDADERLTPKLCKELADLMIIHDNDSVNGVTMEAWLYFMGRKIKHGCHNKRKLMLFKTGIGRIEDRKMDEHTVLSIGTAVYAKERFIHYDFKDMTHWINKMNWYATREMQDYFDFINGKNCDIDGDSTISSTRKNKFGVYYRFPIFLRSHLLFIYYYIFRLGILDGKEGFVYHYMYHRWYRTLVDAKILEQELINKSLKKKDVL